MAPRRPVGERRLSIKSGSATREEKNTITELGHAVGGKFYFDDDGQNGTQNNLVPHIWTPILHQTIIIIKQLRSVAKIKRK